MKRDNAALQILKILATYLAGCLLWLLIFSMSMPPDADGATTEPFPGAICILGIATATMIVFVFNYNAMQKALQKTRSMASNIDVFKDRTERLLEKANKVADKYMSHERSVQIGVAEIRAGRTRVIRSSRQFQREIEENYPDLKANESIMELLAQIKDTENGYAQSKINYNASVEEYNALIHSFPNNLLRKVFKFEDAAFYNSEDDEITDEELGI